MSIDDHVNDEDAKEYFRKFMLFEAHVLRSLRKHYQKLYGLSIPDAEYMSVMQHAEDLRNWYEKKYRKSTDIYERLINYEK